MKTFFTKRLFKKTLKSRPAQTRLRVWATLKYSVLAAFFLVFAPPLFAQSGVLTASEASARSSVGARSAASGLAEQEFRKGVQAYYRGSFNDAIVQFEKALAYLPDESVILEWLGKSYYRAGIEGSSLQQWQYASDSGYGGLLLKNRIEIVRERRVTDANSYDVPSKYSETGTFPGRNGDNLIFSQPVSVLPNSDGSAWILAYGSNELVRMDANGFVIVRTNGTFSGFDRPMDIIRLRGGNLLVSEFAGDKLTEFDKDGKFIKTFGKKGIALGELVGPQYLCQDEDGNILVTDFGNHRVDVFDRDGNALFNFGGKTVGFQGLQAPTGIASYDSFIFVADAYSGAIYKFDKSGNYLGVLCKEKTFALPESMKLWGNFLILCDKNKVYSVDVESGAVFENVSTGNAPSKLTSAVPDANGNILVTDFRSNEVYVMAKMSELVGGLFVQIERVVSDNFPNITLDVKVENRHRQSIVGLKEANFNVTEGKNGVLNYKLEGAAYVNDEADITMIIDRSVESSRYGEAIETAVKEVAASMNNKGTLRVISAGRVPILEYEGEPNGVLGFSMRALKNGVSEIVPLDLAIRLAANALINGEKKNSIVFIGCGKTTNDAFAKYGLADLTAYLGNNSIGFISLLVSQGSANDEINYLCSNTVGGEYYVYRNEGLSGLIDDVINTPSGIYRISYTSSLATDFGQKYLPVEVEAYLMKRSGRDETGYFAPLQ